MSQTNFDLRELSRKFETMQRNMTGMGKEISNLKQEITVLKQENNRFKARFNAIEMRLVARKRREVLSPAMSSKMTGNTLLTEKTKKWHNNFHAKQITKEQLDAMKRHVGKTRNLRRQSIKPSSGREDSYGSASTRSLNAFLYAVGRSPNRKSTHDPDTKSVTSSTKSSRGSKRKK